MNAGGLLILALAVYSQIGLFFCFFVPSGGLMFGAGLLIAAGDFQYSLLLVCLVLTIAAIAGNLTGYLIGRKTGAFLYNRADSRFMKRQYLETGEDFYKKHGAYALVFGTFFPIVRTFSPIIAGVLKMKLQRFLTLSLLGSAAYVLCFTLAGYVIGMLPGLRPYLTYIFPVVVLAVMIPTVARIIKEFKQTKPE